jgi:hypothetical protein
VTVSRRPLLVELGRDLTMDEQLSETVTASCGRANVGIVPSVTGVVIVSRD